jgi:phosphoribosylanthranilate isomerase
MRIKICGITMAEQGREIARMGATDLGFICVQASPRYITPDRLREIVRHLPVGTNTVGVFANESIESIVATVQQAGLDTVQLHGNESVGFCQQLRQALPQQEIIKAWRIRNLEDLDSIVSYTQIVDALLLDAYHPKMLGGTGHTLDWEKLASFHPEIPWLLAGGLTPANISTALSQLHPDGIDLSSGVEISPGNKDLDLVAKLFNYLAISTLNPSSIESIGHLALARSNLPEAIDYPVQ